MIVFGQWNTRTFLSLLFRHAHLVGGNLVVHLQQSIFLYGLGLMASPAVLGTYSVLDKLVSGARMAMVAFSNAIYPFAINTFSEGIENWVALRRKVNLFLGMVLFGVGIIVFIAAPLLAGWLTNTADQSLLADYIRWMSPIPLLIGLNALNVMELLMKKKFHLQFLVSIQLLIAALVASAIFLAPFYFNVASISSVFFVPYLPVYLIFMESITLFVYERNRHHSR
jgi:O-antigen/teichoic acid export membrane protein